MSSHHGFVSILVGIGIIVSVVVLVGLVVVYEFFPNSITPRVERTPNPTPLPSIHEVAEKQGFKILYMDPEDQRGRTVLTLGRGVYDGSGIIFWGTISEPDLRRPRSIVALVGSIEDIIGSQDKIITLRDPITNSHLPRIYLKIAGPSRVSVPELHTTPIFIDNLLKDENPKQVVYVGQLTAEQLREVIQPGDALIAEPVYDPESIEVAEGEGKLWYPTRIILRRIGDNLF